MDILQFYTPFAAALTLFLVAIKYQFGDETVLTINNFGFEIKITKNIAGRIAFSIGAITILSYYIFFDYSKYFPNHLEMEVFYDKDGIEKSLSVFSPEELSDIKAQSYEKKAADFYYAALDEKIKSILKYKQFFSISDGIVHSEGETSFVVQKTSGILNYYIAGSKGELVHSREIPGHATVNCLSFFEKLPSSNDYIRPSIWQIFLKREIVISPKFKQIIAENNKSTGVLFDHTLLGLTKVYIFPYPYFSNTVYFFESKINGLIPVGYAVYR